MKRLYGLFACILTVNSRKLKHGNTPGKFLTYDCKTETLAGDNFSCSLFVTQDRLALYLAGARLLPRPSRVLQAPIADRRQDDRTPARGASIWPQGAATSASWSGYTGRRWLSSLLSSTAFGAFFTYKSLLPSISAECCRTCDNI